jgi:hypothetical protein
MMEEALKVEVAIRDELRVALREAASQRPRDYVFIRETKAMIRVHGFRIAALRRIVARG